MLSTIANWALTIGSFLGAIGFFLAGNDWTGGTLLLVGLWNLYQLIR